MKQISEKEALNRMAAYCSTTERCIQDIEKKLSSFDLLPETCQRIISRLVQESFINESRYATNFTHDKLQFNKWGRIKIEYEMKKKGIPASIRQKAIEEIDQNLYTEILCTILKNKKKTIKAKDKREEYYKLLRFAASRGFESHEINTCLKGLFKENEYDDME
ncbi:regulatory protein RecX [Parabacteroides pacaensis]|uniref:regulatory protein RecX n=1 Tax=Parabacteroides pacaensis TaxID=2086575 RepID=UPI000D10DE86|nr:regulatory protein RecX [Parabacteroides pacaensis]